MIRVLGGIDQVSPALEGSAVLEIGQQEIRRYVERIKGDALWIESGLNKEEKAWRDVLDLGGIGGPVGG